MVTLVIPNKKLVTTDENFSYLKNNVNLLLYSVILTSAESGICGFESFCKHLILRRLSFSSQSSVYITSYPVVFFCVYPKQLVYPKQVLVHTYFKVRFFH